MPDSLYKAMWETIASGKSWEGELKNRKKDGTAYWVNAIISPRRDDEGRIIGYTAIRQDITDKKRIEILAVTDELTGLFNRRQFNRQFPKEMLRAKRDKKVFCLLILDVDHFKKYNDTYGHQEGDAALKKVSAMISSRLKRAGDSAYRLGGEEFGALFSQTDTAGAERYAESIRKAVEDAAIPHKKNPPTGCVTVSVGVAILDFSKESSSRPDTRDALYRIADDMLYRAKSQGRNRTVCERF
jgi:diguanylate cyclase (GGDEF)-like protein